MTAAVQVRDDRAPDRSEHQVGLVLVSHDGARWLTDVLAAIASQTRPADALVAVDTGSTDDTVAILQDRLEHAVVLRLPADAGFGAAVASGAAHLSKTAATTDQPTDRAGRTDWLWILHDDSAPAPDALGRLLEQAADDVALIGPKSLEWPQPRRLLEVGVTLTGTGRRETGLEQGERDQGQHDGPAMCWPWALLECSCAATSGTSSVASSRAFGCTARTWTLAGGSRAPAGGPGWLRPPSSSTWRPPSGACELPERSAAARASLGAEVR